MEVSDLANKVIIVAGGAGLLGREFVKSLLENKAIVIIADINEKTGKEFSKKLKKKCKTGTIDFVKLDISSKKLINEMIKYVVKRYKKIDAFVNCTLPKNENWYKNFEDTEYKDFCKHLDLHLGGYFLTTQQLMGFYKKQGHGNIINIASMYGVIPPKFEIYEDTEMTTPVGYATAKAAIIHLTKYLAKYYKGYNVRFNCISPGGILNDQPARFLENFNKHGLSKGMIDASEVAGTLLYLLSDKSRHVNGHNLIVDDGWTL